MAAALKGAKGKIASTPADVSADPMDVIPLECQQRRIADNAMRRKEGLPPGRTSARGVWTLR